MGYPDTFKGFAVHSRERWSDFKLLEYKPRAFTEYDVDVKISHCGVCGSDVHTLRNQGTWAGTNYPIVVGHEIVGKAVKVGSKVQDVKVGDTVGVGAQIGSCGECKFCKTGNENYCNVRMIDTYGSTFDDGTFQHGGYANYIRAHTQFTFKIPHGVPEDVVAPMLCGGLTCFSPLVRNGAGPGKKVGIVGIGGLGHFGVLFAAALGAEVYAISHSANKKADALKMGAHHFVITSEKNWAEPLRHELDLIISTTNSSDDYPLQDYLSLLTVHGKFISVGIPEAPFPQMRCQDFTSQGAFLGASHIGNKNEALQMLELAAKQNIKSWIQPIKLSDAGCKQAVESVEEGKARYRFVLTDFADEKFA